MIIEITNITKEMLMNADETFFTGSATEITPIATIDKTPIGDGKPGVLTLKLKDIYLKIVHGKEPQYHNWLTFVNANIRSSDTVLENH